MMQPFIIKNCFGYGGKTIESVCQEEIDDMAKRGYEPVQIATTDSSLMMQKIVILFKLTVEKNGAKKDC